MNIARISVLRPIAMAMVILFTVILGIISLKNLTVDLFPDLTFPVAAVTVQYEGAGPEEIEQLLTVPIEEMMSTLTNVESVTSTSRPGGALILVSFTWGTDMNFATLQMRERIDMIRDSFPSDVRPPTVLRFDPGMLPVVQFAITEPNSNLTHLKKLAENEIKPLLNSIEGVASVSIEGGTEQEILVQANIEKLASYGLTFRQLQQLLRSENINLSGAQITDKKQNLPIRISGNLHSIYDVKQLPVPTNRGIVQLGQLVTVTETVKPLSQASYLDGTPGIGISILKENGSNTVSVVRTINEKIAQLQDELPEGIEIKSIFDQSRFIEQSIRAVSWNMAFGSILAAFVLFLFLRNLRSTLIISVSIPISILSTFLLLYFSGQTLNLLTLGGLALGIGMMVDNAIVILENIYRLRQNGLSLKDAAIEGTAEIGGAIIASTLTTVVVFLPIVFVDGLAAQLFKPLALSIAFSLIASLFTALMIVPLLSSTYMKVPLSHTRTFQYQRMTKSYQLLLKKVLAKPKTMIIITTFLCLLSLIGIPFLGTEFLPAQDQSYINIDAQLASGSSLDQTYSLVEDIDEKLKDISEIDAVFVNLGGSNHFSLTPGSQTNRASYSLLLAKPSQRSKSDLEIAEEIRERLKMIPVDSLSVTASDNGFTDDPISITITGHDLQTLHTVASNAISIIETIPGVREPSSNFAFGHPEINVSINRERASYYGVSSAQIANTIHDATRGLIPTHITRNGYKIEVRLIAEEGYSTSLQKLSQLLIETPIGDRIPLEMVATIERNQGPNSIKRRNSVREITIKASILNRDLGTVMDEIRDKISNEISLPIGYEVTYGGQFEQMKDAFSKLGWAIALAVLLVYMVMAARFESFYYPLIIMFSIPLTTIGIITGLLLSNQPFGVGSLIGVLILTGIVVNNAIVLVDYMTTLKRNGKETYEAIMEAGPTRLRPILMTTFTTILGLIPLTLGFGEGTEIQQPMAIVIVFGLSFATIITLLFIPAVYYVFDERKKNQFRV
ncbi:efflux RND transporter permease subunit [Anaerobacillus sp. MEB173]|uniref:efflux RND transporter permease subunit n=1 Tax=Anaerobacillus sp. MEB173 TaxID=3383345 RepID=UPI003F92D90E